MKKPKKIVYSAIIKANEEANKELFGDAYLHGIMNKDKLCYGEFRDIYKNRSVSPVKCQQCGLILSDYDYDANYYSQYGHIPLAKKSINKKTNSLIELEKWLQEVLINQALIYDDENEEFVLMKCQVRGNKEIASGETLQQLKDNFEFNQKTYK
jgi:hypothetical protein